MTSAAIAAIEAELARLGLDADGLGPNASVAVQGPEDDQEIPEGWVRLYDDWSSNYGPADAVLAALRAISDGEGEAAWEAFDDRFPDRPPGRS